MQYTRSHNFARPLAFQSGWQSRYSCLASRAARRLLRPMAVPSLPAICFSAAPYTTTIPTMFNRGHPAAAQLHAALRA